VLTLYTTPVIYLYRDRLSHRLALRRRFSQLAREAAYPVPEAIDLIRGAVRREAMRGLSERATEQFLDTLVSLIANLTGLDRQIGR
jgi:hypothetical protein